MKLVSLNSNKVVLQKSLPNRIHVFYKEGFVKRSLYSTVIYFHVHFRINMKCIDRKEKRKILIDKYNK